MGDIDYFIFIGRYVPIVTKLRKGTNDCIEPFLLPSGFSPMSAFPVAVGDTFSVQLDG